MNTLLTKLSNFKNSKVWSVAPFAFFCYYLLIVLSLWPDEVRDLHDNYVFWTWYQALIYIPLTLMVYSCFTPRISLMGVATCFITSSLLADQEIIDVHFHHFMNIIDAYPNIWKTPSGAVNSNYAKLWLYLAALPIFLTLFAKKEFRTMDRLFITITTFVMITTITLFHHFWISQEYRQVYKREIGHIASTLLLKDNRDFQQLCLNNHYLCFNDYNAEDKQIIHIIDHGQALIAGIDDLFKRTECYDKPCVTLSVNTPIAANVNSKTKQKRVLVDRGYMTIAFAETRFNLALLGIIASTTWIYGMIFLIFFHRKKLEQRKKRIGQLKPVPFLTTLELKKIPSP